jgi:uncharacterized protein YggE
MKKSFLITFLLTSVCSFGQVELPLPQKPFIEVTGTASREVIPDKIFISIILSDKVIDNEKYTIEAQEGKLKKSLTKINIDLNNLFLSDAASEITRDKKKETGFKVTKEFTLQVKNSDEVSKVFKELYAINIKESSILKTESSKIDSLRKEVRIAAIKAAKNKAEYLLAAIGEQIDKPLEVREQEDIPYYRDNISNNTSFNVRLNDTDNKPNETNFQKFTIKFSYYIKYSIK